MTATFADAGFEVKYTKRDGADGQLEPFRPRLSHIKRRGTASHLVYEVLHRQVVTSEEKIKQVHGTRGPQPHTMYYAMHRDTEHTTLMAMVSWSDSGRRVAVREMVRSPTSPARPRQRYRSC